MGLTKDGRRLSRRIAAVEERLYCVIDGDLADQPVDETLRTLRALASALPAGDAVARRREASTASDR